MFLVKYSGEARLSTLVDLFFAYINRAWRSSLFSNAFYLMLNTITTSLLGFVFWNIMARFFPPAEVGIGSALIAASGLIGSLANLGLGVGLVRFIPQVKDKAGSLINTSFTLVGCITLGGSLVYLLGLGHWSPALGFVGKSIWLAGCFVVFSIATALSALIDQSIIAGRAAGYVFWKNTLACLLKLPLPVFAFAFLAGFGIFTGTGVAVLAGNILAWYFFLPSIYKGYRPRPAWDKELLAQVLPYSSANYLANLLNGAPSFIYPLMVLNTLGPENSAYFYVAWMMNGVLSVIPSGLASSLFAEGSHDQQRLVRDGRRALGIALLLSVPAVIAMIVLSRWFLHFFGPGYAEKGTGVIRFLALAVIPQCVNQLYITVNQVKKRVFLIICQTLSLAVLSLGLGDLMLEIFGLNGIGIAYFLAHLVVAIVVAVPLWRALHESGKEISH
ncbi:lipopolysaccharide biosynthesis protein [Neomoorella thermoacetica]|uniref:lipopolysaccharide biosynthesis protein n=1 Tax=Neomoorella thermoacetica TaxID=1525 RepID=UPI0008FB004A|nr:lipopolysaccharide biosynthesis protein [Moorella thermoacetica]OIQ52724.1 polysaccharide biosynthesis protein [Moorella thermoacetica]